MAITFEKTPLEWNNAGTEPSTDLKTNGFVAGYKPAADTFNYQINNSSACLTELQTKLSGLDSSMIKGIRGKGTLITPMSDQTVNITAASVGAAASSHNHTADNITSGTLPIARGGTGGATASAARANLELKKEYVLYENASGINSTITLSDSYKNYDTLIIYYALFNGRGSIVLDVNNTISSPECIISGGYSDITATKLQFKTCILTFSGKTITFGRNYSIDISTSPSVSYRITENVSVLKVSGYKN